MTLITHAPGQKIKSADETANQGGLADGSNDLTSNSLAYFRRKAVTNYVISGLILPPSSANLLITISLGEAIVNGKYVAPITTIITCTASKDQYVDLKDDGTIVATAGLSVANNAASPAITVNTDGSNAMRIGKLIASGSAVVQSLQGAFNSAPVAPNTLNWFGFDSLGNAVFNASPTNTTLGYSNRPTAASTNTTASTAINLGVTVNIPANRRIKITVHFPTFYNAGATAGNIICDIYDGAVGSGTLIAADYSPAAPSTGGITTMTAIITPAAGVKTYNVGIRSASTNTTAFVDCSALTPATILVELN